MRHTLKYILYLVVLFIVTHSLTLNSKTKNWQVIDTIPGFIPNIVTWYYYGLQSADSLNFMILAKKNGNSGYYFRRTTDGGISWVNVYKDTSYYIDYFNKNFVPVVQEIAYPNTNLFIAVGDSGLVIRSTDKGETWQKFSIRKNLKISTLRMLDENYGVIQCSNYGSDTSLMMFTYDGGLSWESVNVKYDLSMVNILTRNLLYGGRTIKTKDSIYVPYVVKVYNSWESYDTIRRPDNVAVMHFINEKQGWIAGGKKVFDSAGWTSKSQLIYRTDDGGQTWQKQCDTVLNGTSIIDIRFFDENFGIASSFDGWALITTNGGKSWNAEKIDSFPNNDGATHDIRYVQFPSPTTAIVVEDWRLIYKYTREPANGVEESEITFGDMHISPNPATDFLEISYSLTINHRVNPMVDPDIEIFNVFGQKVINLTPALSIHGEGVRFDVSGLSPGVYLVKVGEKVGKFLKI